ncbi:MAG: hypothetical protein K2H35_07880 [Muribaculaceae bacterium]|nr:hypothetical protein [Muribaculaceae bacterium]MDE6558754.1 hypothetical protein [Muribaculaceae bacterium]
MPNKRDFKKYADALGASVVEEMMVSYYNVEGADRKAIAGAVGKVLEAIEDAKNKSNVFFERGVKSFADHKEYAKAKHEFFRALFNNIETEFGAKIDEAVKEFNAALPESYKAAQKEIANA